jgi:1-acyl-sn-glycerol-3-phosphate acyltransferase
VLFSLCVFPLCSDRKRLALKASWAAALLDALGVEVEADLTHAVPGALLVANHISWIDIYVINSALPAAFVSKEEVRHWPLIGWLAAKNDTIFLRRGSRGHAKVINEQVAEFLDKGRHVAVFPEGTTTDGRSLLHFHAALIQPALSAGRPGTRWPAQPGAALRRRYFDGAMHGGHPWPKTPDCPAGDHASARAEWRRPQAGGGRGA